MPGPYTHLNLHDVDDAAARFGFGGSQESRFANGDLETEQTGLSLHFIRPGARQPFAHRHGDVEEVYVVLAGSGSVILDDEEVPLRVRDAVRVGPGVVRSFTAGQEGLEILAVSPLRPDDKGEIIPLG